MNNKELILKIKNETWYITLSEVAQISFAYAIPYEKSVECLNPLWFNWDYEPYEPEMSWSSTGAATNISPFVLKKKLLNSVVNLINKSKVTFFYFTPTSKQKGKIYANLVKLLISKLEGKWDTQIIEKNWFYFSKL